MTDERPWWRDPDERPWWRDADERPWWRDAVIYQIYPRSFRDADGDGIGDLRGIADGLDHIARLGVDAIWLSPIFVSPMADFGYDVADYCDIDPVFGTVADLDDLVSSAHARGIRVLLDWVPNHTSDQHPWFVDSRSAVTSERRDWYVWKDPAPGGGPPNNWIAAFEPVPAWTFDEASGQYYLHSFLPQQPDLNWANPDVEAAMHDTLRFWLDRGVDGFRADVVHLIGKGTDLPALSDEQARMVVPSVDVPFTHELLRRVRAVLDGYPHEPMIVGEVYLLEPGQTLRYLGDGDELHLTFDFRPLHSRWDPESLRAIVELAQQEFAEPAWPTWVLSNHDRPRHRTRYRSVGRARAAAVLSLTVRGTPFLYAGEELGLEDAVIPPDRVVDPGGRDGCRAPIPWTRAVDHGWGSDPWLPFPPDPSERSVEAQDHDPDSMVSLYRSLLSLRRSTPALLGGDMEVLPVDESARGLVAFRRRLGPSELLVAINMGADPLPVTIEGDVVVASDGDGSLIHQGVLGIDEAVVVASPDGRTPTVHPSMRSQR